MDCVAADAEYLEATLAAAAQYDDFTVLAVDRTAVARPLKVYSRCTQ